MSECALFHIHQVQTRVDVSGKLPLEKINDNASRGRGFDVALSNRRARVDDHNILSCTSCFDRHLFGHKLGSLVRADHIVK